MVLRCFRFFLLTTLLLFFATGCAERKGLSHSGFLEDYSRLEAVEKNDLAKRYKKEDVDWSKYDKLLIDRILVWQHEDSEYKGIDPTELKAMTDYFYEAIVEEFKDDNILVDEVGDNVVRLRIAITDIISTNPGMSVLTFVTPYAWAAEMADEAVDASSYTYFGGAAVEMEVLDSVSNERLAALVERKYGTKYGLDLEKAPDDATKEAVEQYFNSYTNWGYAKQSFEQWAKWIRKRWDEVHGKLPE